MAQMTDFKPELLVYTGLIQPYALREAVTVPANTRLLVATNVSYFGLEQTSANINVLLSGSQQPFNLLAGQAIKLFQDTSTKSINTWDRVTLWNQTGADITVTYIAAIGDFIDNRITISAPLQPATPGVRSTGQVAVTNAAVQIVPANTTRKSAIVRNDPLAGTTLFVGNAGVTTATGFPLQPGEAQIFEASQAIFGIRGTAISYTTFFIDESF